MAQPSPHPPVPAVPTPAKGRHGFVVDVQRGAGRAEFVVLAADIAQAAAMALRALAARGEAGRVLGVRQVLDTLMA